MFYSRDEDKKIKKQFFEKHHGLLTKLTDKNGNIFAYLLRCEAKPGKKNLIVFSIVPNISYAKVKRLLQKDQKISLNFSSLGTVKHFAIKRALNKWKNIKKQSYIKYDSVSNEDLLNNITNDLMELLGSYKSVKNCNIDFDIKEIGEYILKEYSRIKNYYKETDEINVLFL